MASLSRDEIRAHVALGHEKLRAARDLLEGDYLRDSASRAYYCMVHATRALLLTKGRSPKTHRGLASEVAREFVKPGVLPAAFLDDLRVERGIREMGDFDVSFAMDETDVATLIEKAEAFLGEIERILASGGHL